MPTPSEEVRHVWSSSARFVPRTVVRPLQRFLATEAAGGIALLIAAAVALAWANSPVGDTYERFWRTPVTLSAGNLRLDHLDLRAWVNDGLMAVFFFVAGLEIKRELTSGELRDRRAAALPAMAALGGMIVPALIYMAFNAGRPTSGGWGIPMATDIAFAVGVLSLLGRRIPTGAKVFLLSLAIADDIGAILVIAVFYAGGVSLLWLAGAVAALAGVVACRRADVRSLAPYLVLGACCWVALLQSGVHATLSGVALGLLTPVWSFHEPRTLLREAPGLVAVVEGAYADDRLTAEELDESSSALDDLARLATETRSPLQRLESRLAPWAAFVIVPVFALANAGVHISGGAVAGALDDPVFLGVGVGLVVGKTVGVVAATAIAVGLGVGRLPAGTDWRHVVGLGLTAGIGFTVALFVTGLSFDDPAATDSAKLGIFAASVVAGLAGYLWLRVVPRPDGAIGPAPPVALSAPVGA